MAINQDACCGCLFEADYGTSILEGDGTHADPISFSQVDPEFERPVARVERVTAQSIPNNTPTAISFTSAVTDSHVMWNVGNPTRLTIQVDGFYLMGFSGRWASANAIREVFFRQTNFNFVAELDRQSQIKVAAVSHDFSANYNWFFTAGDYIEIVAFQTSGVALDISGDATSPMNFWAIYLGKKT